MISSNQDNINFGLPADIPYQAILLLTVVLMLMGFFIWIVGRKKDRIEDPARIASFLQSLQICDWKDVNNDAPLNALYAAVTTLFEAEIKYYYLSRITRRRVSILTRSTAFLCGTLGLVCPLLATAMPEWSGLTRLGYLFFAGAATSLAANELFGGTQGHIRAVSIQYKLEALLQRFAVDWQEWRAGYAASQKAGTEIGHDGAFDLIKNFSESAYLALQAETKEWSSGTLAAAAAYQKSLDEKRSV